MKSNHAAIGRQAFRRNADAAVNNSYKSYKSHADAIATLRKVIDDGRKFALLFGPKDSGKTIIINRLCSTLVLQNNIIAIDGASLEAQQLVSTLLSRLGCSVKLQTIAEILELIHVIVVHKARISRATILVIENIDRMTPDALQVLGALAEVETYGEPAIQLILTGRGQSRAVLASQEMASIAARTSSYIEIGPMTRHESVNYIYSRLSAIGVKCPDSIFPLDYCEHLYELSGGWPALLDDCARRAMAQTDQFPARLPEIAKAPKPTAAKSVAAMPATAKAPKPTAAKSVAATPATAQSKPAKDVPTLLFSHSGRLVGRYPINDKRVVVGRSLLSDIRLDNDYVSKFHVMLHRIPNALILIDLNSSNGTYVNSKKVKTTVLKESDIISLGRFRIKVKNVPLAGKTEINVGDVSDTAKMRTLTEQRSRRLQHTAIQFGPKKIKA